MLSGDYGFYLSWWNHPPHKWNKNSLEPRTEVLGWQVLWNGAEHSFKLVLIKLCCYLALSHTSDIIMAGGNAIPSSHSSYKFQYQKSLAKNNNVVDSSLIHTSYLSQRSCAPLISPSLRWVRISPKLSLLFRNSIQAIPLWMKETMF